MSKPNEQVAAIAERFQIVLMFEDGEWYGRGLELPLVMADGKTPDECVAATREALMGVASLMLEKGRRPPPPSPR